MVETCELYHSFDAKLARNMGEQSVSSNVQAIMELIKNAFDADARECKVHFYAKSEDGESIDMEKIVIEDTGFGMTFEDFTDKWMRVATSNKEKENYTPILGRRVTGEKGMGRFASQRLGNIIKIISNPLNYKGRIESSHSYNTMELNIDWNMYKAGKDFEKIGNRLNVLDTCSEDCGIKIEISNLKDQWTKNNIDDILINAGTLISPKFSSDQNNSFKIEIIPHGFVLKRTKIESVIEKYAPWEIRAQMTENKINYQILHRKKTDAERKSAPDLENKMSRGDISTHGKTCGNAKITLFIYEGRTSQWAPGVVRNYKELEYQLDENYGIKIFNDAIRIMPYGKKGNDWAELDTRWARRTGGTVRSRNVIGYIFLTREHNPNIIETTTREGLIENGAFKFLKKEFLLKVLDEFENYRKEFDNEEKWFKAKSRPGMIAQSDLHKLEEFLARSDLDDYSKSTARNITSSIKKQVVKQEKEKEEEKEEMTSILEMYRNLASLGISALAFHHEIRQCIGRIHQRQHMLIKKWPDWLDEKKRDYITKTMLDVKTVIDFNSYIREFASLFSGLKGTKTRREKIDLVKSVDEFRIGFNDILESQGITIHVQTLQGKLNDLYMNKASWESIMINLLSNSIRALGNVSRENKYIKIRFEKTDAHLNIEVEDNGYGISSSDFNRIFDTLWTSYKSPSDSGTGMGATIVKEIIEKDYDGSVKVKFSIYEKDSPGNGQTIIQIQIPLKKLGGRD